MIPSESVTQSYKIHVIWRNVIIGAKNTEFHLPRCCKTEFIIFVA